MSKFILDSNGFIWGYQLRVTRIELAPQAWEAGILPLNYTRSDCEIILPNKRKLFK
jgi:hypothetical protein